LVGGGRSHALAQQVYNLDLSTLEQGKNTIYQLSILSQAD
jgi:hypothetical protein